MALEMTLVWEGDVVLPPICSARLRRRFGDVAVCPLKDGAFWMGGRVRWWRARGGGGRGGEGVEGVERHAPPTRLFHDSTHLPQLVDSYCSYSNSV